MKQPTYPQAQYETHKQADIDATPSCLHPQVGQEHVYLENMSGQQDKIGWACWMQKETSSRFTWENWLT